MKSSYDIEANAYYFGGSREAFTTQRLGECEVLIDYDRRGEVIGVEVLPSSRPEGHMSHRHNWRVEPSGFGVGFMKVCVCGQAKHIGGV